MDIEKVESIIHEDDFSNRLQILQLSKWDKATNKEKLDFFGAFLKKISGVYNECGNKLVVKKINDFNDSKFSFDKDVVYVSPEICNDDNNPYYIINSFMFELCFYIRSVNSNKYDINDKKSLAIFVNMTRSNFGEWDNFIGRDNIEFMNQPISYYSFIDAYKFIYDLVCYMNQKYGMDQFISNVLSDYINLNGILDDMRDKANSNYKKMLVNFGYIEDENKMFDRIDNFLDDVIYNLDDINDNVFYSMINNRVLYCCREEDKERVYKQLAKRMLKNHSRVGEIVDSIKVEEEGDFELVTYGQNTVKCSMGEGINFVFSMCITDKIGEGIVDEVNDYALIEKAKECHNIFAKIDKINYYEYSSSAYYSMELGNKIGGYYYDLMTECINNSEIFKGSKCGVYHYPFSENEAYLQYAYDKSYDEVKNEQFDNLKAQYAKMTGGRR